MVRWSSRPSQGWVSLSHISKQTVGAIVVSEDWDFFSHHGFDIHEIKKAFKTNLKRKKFAFGASTITQQVARNLFLSKKKTLPRKLKEIFIAVLLEKIVGKEKILETYFNIVEWGDGIYGISRASHYYFEKEASALSPQEGAFLAMLLPNPRGYSRAIEKRGLTFFAQNRIHSILEKMIKARYLSEDEYVKALSSPLNF